MEAIRDGDHVVAEYGPTTISGPVRVSVEDGQTVTSFVGAEGSALSAWLRIGSAVYPTRLVRDDISGPFALVVRWAPEDES